MTALAVLFWTCLGICVSIYFGYPSLVALLARLRPRPVDRERIHPPVTLVIPAYNEEGVIGEKLENSLELDYPPDRLEVLVVSDGSTDGTDAAVRGFMEEHPGRVRLLRQDRTGKARALNRGAAEARGEILAFTDANALLDRLALARLVEPFADPLVGGVCAQKRYRVGAGADATEYGEGVYWRFDQWQKKQESLVGSVFAADGTLYAIRRDLYRPLTDLAQADDIAISTRVVLQGYRLLFEPGAVAWETAPEEGRKELHRKIRVTNHSVRALWNLGPALWTSGFYSVELLFHKFVRHLVPFFLVPMFIANLLLAPSSPLYAILFAGQAVFYGLAGIGASIRHRRTGHWRIFSIPYYFCLVNLAALLGVLSILRGERRARWEPRRGLTESSEESSTPPEE